MYDYKKMLHWVICKEPRFDFDLEEPYMVVWLAGDNRTVLGNTVDNCILNGMELEEHLRQEEFLDED